MKRISSILCFLGIMSLCAAQNVIYNDPGPQLKITGNGFNVGKAFIATDSALQQSNQLNFNTKYYMVISGIEGFKRQKDKVFPGVRIFITDLANNTILDTGDLLANDKEGMDTADAREIAPNIFTADPMRHDAFYVFNVEIWDKKGKARMHATYTFGLNPYNYKYEQLSGGLTTRNLFVFQGETLTYGNRVKMDKQTDYIFYGAGPFTVTDNKLYPGCRIMVIDNNNQILFESDDLYAGMAIDTGKNGPFGELKVFFTPNNELEIGVPYKLGIIFWDKKSDRTLEVEIPFVVEH